MDAGNAAHVQCAAGSGEHAQLAFDARPFARGNALVQLDAQHRHLPAARAKADQRGTANVGVGVEHGLDLLCVERVSSPSTRCDLRPQNHNRPS
jgi:hypothetical protein